MADDNNVETGSQHATGLLEVARRSVMWVTERPPLVMVSGRGSYLWDAQGKQYLDFVQGWAVNTLGHCAPELTAVLQQQSEQLWNSSAAYYNDCMVRCAKQITSMAKLERVFFANSGAEANEGAIKLARRYGEKHLQGAYQIITTTASFHGRTLATMAASGKPGWENLFLPRMPGFVQVEFGNAQAVEKAINSKTCAVMVEPIQGEAGVRVPPPNYLKQLSQICEKHRKLLILDEIQTGIGRLAHPFACQHFGVKPHLLTLGKGLGGGFPVAALLAQENVCVFEAGDQGGTFGGQPLAMAVASTVLHTIQQVSFLQHVQQMGQYLRQLLQQLAASFELQELRGIGLLQALNLPKPLGAKIVTQALQNGLLINSPQPNCLRFMPALNIHKKQLDEFAEKLHTTLQQTL